MTPRDLDILSSLTAVRYLTTEHLVWLHWPDWWRAMEQNVRTMGGPRRPPRKAYARLQVLTHHGLLVRVTRTIDRAMTVYHRLASCYTLTRQGAALLAEQRGERPTEIWMPPHARRAALTLEHSLGIGAVYAALSAEARYRGVGFEAWQADHALCRDYDTVVVAGHAAPLPVLPDAGFRLAGGCCFLEVDRGTSTASQWRTKALALHAYQGDPRLRTRWGADHARILVVVPSRTRMTGIARTIRAAVPESLSTYRFLLAEHVHPLGIRRRWQQVAPASPTASTQMTFLDDPLWLPAPGATP